MPAYICMLKEHLTNINWSKSSDLDSYGFKFNGNFQQNDNYLNKRHVKITLHMFITRIHPYLLFFNSDG